MKTTTNKKKSLNKKSVIKKHISAKTSDGIVFQTPFDANEITYKAFFENSMDAILLTSPDGIIHSANPAACKMFERSEEEICRIGRNGVVDLSDPRLKDALKERTDTGSFFGELIMVKKSGEKFPAEISTAIFSDDEKGQLTTMIIRDITKQKLAETKLKASEEEYRSLFENSIVGISQSFPVGKYLRINKAYAEMYGYPDTTTMLAEIKNNTKMLFSNPEDRKKVLEILNEKGFMAPTEFELNKRNGEKFWALVGAKQVVDNTGKLLYLQAEHIDITSRKKTEEELRKSKKMLEKLNQHLVEVREKERNKIALNLHDDLGQKLTALNLNIAWLKSRIGVQTKTVHEKFEEMSSMIKETIESIKETSAFLRPAILFDLGLVPAINSHLTNFEKQTGIKCKFYFKPEEFLIDERLSLIIYRILQESFTNIARHSGATNAEVNLHIIKNKIEMTIKDNGRGIEKDKVNSLKSMGIEGMRERIKSVHGKITFSGERGSGTRIKVIIPLLKANNDD